MSEPGDGHCQVCGHACTPGFLMCRRHWTMCPRRLQNKVYRALSDWRASEITLSELRAVQEEAVEAVSEAIHA